MVVKLLDKVVWLFFFIVDFVQKPGFNSLFLNQLLLCMFDKDDGNMFPF